MATGGQIETRPVLSQQPAQCLLIDLARPFTYASLNLVAECVHNVLPIISVLPGPPRVPLLGIMMANNSNGLREEVVLGFEKVRGNFTKCFESTRSMHTEFQCSDRMNCQSISAALIKALTLFQSVNKRPGAQHELEVTIISSLIGYKVREQVMKAVSTFETQFLKLVTIFSSVNIEHAVNIDELEVSGDEQQSSCEVLINIQHVLLSNIVAEDRSVLSQHFMGWLSDRCRDSHHLQLTLPHPYTEGKVSTMKFDLKEFILPCAALPFHNTTNVELTAAFIKPPHFAAKSETVQYSVPVYQLAVLHRVPYSSRLIPFLYGVAMVLEATQCWRIDWDELETNKNDIGALHAVLHEQKLALVCQLDAKGEEGATPQPYYCVVPAECCLLVHSLAYKELLVYSKDVMNSSQLLPAVNYQCKIDMEMALAKVDMKEDSFNAKDLNNAGYIRSITRSILPKRLSSRKRPITSSASAVKRKGKYAPLQGCQPMEVSSTGSTCRQLYQHEDSVAMASPHDNGSSELSLPVLKKPVRPRAVVRSLVRPTISSQIEECSAVEEIRSNGSRWISRDNSHPYPTAQSFQLSSVCRSLPTSYKQRTGTTSCPAPVELSDDELGAELPTHSPMQYDGLSQHCPRASQVDQPPDGSGFTFADETGGCRLTDSESAHGKQSSFTAAYDGFEDDIDGFSDDSICYVERADGTLSPQ